MLNFLIRHFQSSMLLRVFFCVLLLVFIANMGSSKFVTILFEGRRQIAHYWIVSADTRSDVWKVRDEKEFASYGKLNSGL